MKTKETKQTINTTNNKKWRINNVIIKSFRSRIKSQQTNHGINPKVILSFLNNFARMSAHNYGSTYIYTFDNRGYQTRVKLHCRHQYYTIIIR